MTEAGYLQCMYRIRNAGSDFAHIVNGIPRGFSKKSLIVKLKAMRNNINKVLLYLGDV